MGEATQELFLLEFLVDKVNIPSVQALHDEVLPVTTCIEFKILNLPPIYVSQDSSNEKCTCLGEDPQVFRKGKSCLFGVPQRLLQKPICAFPVAMTVYKKLPATVLPDVMVIGSCEIDTKDMLNGLLDQQGCPSPDNSRAIKNKFRISTATGQCVGDVCLFLRLTRLGRKVVTQFQNPHNRKPYLFKGQENSPVFQCRRVPSRLPADKDPLQSCVCGPPECEQEPAPEKTCCSKSAGRRQRGLSKKPKRPCCPSKSKRDQTNTS